MTQRLPLGGNYDTKVASKEGIMTQRLPLRREL